MEHNNNRVFQYECNVIMKLKVYIIIILYHTIYKKLYKSICFQLISIHIYVYKFT